jgi:3'-phosphoadenosine 5'-phosphosulfate sulfotransferase (PAPS reductase)/FAD synthetase
MKQQFICQLNIPYCVLYDRGYTSLGGTTDTSPNPALRRSSISETGRTEVIFRPAYELIADNEERLGREKEWKPTAGSGMMHRVEGGMNDVAVAVEDEDTESAIAAHKGMSGG